MYAYTIKYNGIDQNVFVDDEGNKHIIVPLNGDDYGNTSIVLMSNGMISATNEFSNDQEGISRLDRDTENNMIVSYMNKGGKLAPIFTTSLEEIEEFPMFFGLKSKAIKDLCEQEDAIKAQCERQETLLKIRRYRMDLSLRELGFDNVSDLSGSHVDNNRYKDLRRFGAMLDGYKDLSGYVKLRNKDNLLIANPIDELDIEYVRKVQQSCKRDIGHMNGRYDIVDRQVSAYSEYLKPMFRVLGRYKTGKYISMTQKLALLYMSFNHDLLRPEELEEAERVAKRLGIEFKDLTMLPAIEKQDAIAQIVDSKEFEDICEIEDEYYEKETLEFESKIDYLLTDFESVSTTIQDGLKELTDDTELIRTSRKEKQQRYKNSFNPVQSVNIIFSKDDDEIR